MEKKWRNFHIIICSTNKYFALFWNSNKSKRGWQISSSAFLLRRRFLLAYLFPMWLFLRSKRLPIRCNKCLCLRLVNKMTKTIKDEIGFFPRSHGSRLWLWLSISNTINIDSQMDCVCMWLAKQTIDLDWEHIGWDSESQCTWA